VLALLPFVVAVWDDVGTFLILKGAATL
jgi:hypothetical protein